MATPNWTNSPSITKKLCIFKVTKSIEKVHSGFFNRFRNYKYQLLQSAKLSGFCGVFWVPLLSKNMK